MADKEKETEEQAALESLRRSFVARKNSNITLSCRSIPEMELQHQQAQNLEGVESSEEDDNNDEEEVVPPIRLSFVGRRDSKISLSCRSVSELENAPASQRKLAILENKKKEEEVLKKDDGNLEEEEEKKDAAQETEGKEQKDATQQPPLEKAGSQRRGSFLQSLASLGSKRRLSFSSNKSN